ncbi:hypothetical protein OH799_04905 [Nocardia sp. NBC_00881]|uniref:hypothetical protein n=1 Tax=Nocardia sp. NBC_00881 TaxID=2975995 RepID=UPI003867A9A8|nr:hypothetical protein OH799_04905 [Nocardia sp. NBC_00881]
MKIINDERAVMVRLTSPTDNGFLMLGAEIGRWAGPLPLPAPTRRRVLARIGPLCRQLARRDDVVEATAFHAALRPPGEGARLLRRAGVRPARYDVVVLIRTTTVDDLAALRVDPTYRDLVALLESSARHVHLTSASSPARIADVDHSADHWFLFNYFHCRDWQTVFDVWHYTAGWFQRKTALPDSVPMQPLPGEPDDYTLINHASWPTLRTFLPSLLFRPTFRTFVLANFAANDIAAQPTIYRRLH